MPLYSGINISFIQYWLIAWISKWTISSLFHLKSSTVRVLCIPSTCNYAQRHSQTRAYPGINFFCPTYHQQYNILQNNSNGSWCLESMYFPIQSAIKPRIKRVAKLILTHVPVRSRSHEFVEWMVPYRRSLRPLCSHETYKAMPVCLKIELTCLLPIVHGFYDGVNLKYDFWPGIFWQGGDTPIYSVLRSSSSVKMKVKDNHRK